MIRYKIADVVFDAKTIYKFSEKLCENYRYDGDEQPEFTVIITPEDINQESKILSQTQQI